MSSDDHSRQLVERAIGGDAVALKVLLTNTRRRLEAYLSTRVSVGLRQGVEVDDVIQEAHIEVFRRISSFEPRGADSFFRWVAAISISRVRNDIRRQRTYRRGGDWPTPTIGTRRLEDSTIALLDMLAGPDRTPSASVARVEAIDAVQMALETLPEHYRQAVWSVHIDGRSVRQTAGEMGRSERAVHGLCRRGLKLLEDHLQSATRFLSSTG